MKLSTVITKLKEAGYSVNSINNYYSAILGDKKITFAPNDDNQKECSDHAFNYMKGLSSTYGCSLTEAMA